MDKNMAPLRPQTPRSPKVGFVYGFNTQHRIESSHKKRSKCGEKYYRCLKASKHHDGERHPGKNGNWPESLKHWKGVVLELPRPTHKKP